MIDRSLRPIFPSFYTNDTQIVCNLMALDDTQNQDVISINTGSLHRYFN
jgi:polyribonucleotide nucleotidyltransferase